MTFKQLDHIILHTKKEIKPGCWKYSMVQVRDEDGDLVLEFERNYPSPNPATWYPFEYNGKRYAFFGRKYNALEIIDLESKIIITDPTWHHDLCPIEFKYIHDGIFILNYVLWAAPGSCLGLVSIQDIANKVLQHSFIDSLHSCDFENFNIKDIQEYVSQDKYPNMQDDITIELEVEKRIDLSWKEIQESFKKKDAI